MARRPPIIVIQWKENKPTKKRQNAKFINILWKHIVPKTKTIRGKQNRYKEQILDQEIRDATCLCRYYVTS